MSFHVKIFAATKNLVAAIYISIAINKPVNANNLHVVFMSNVYTTPDIDRANESRQGIFL